jgi:hypothetical protein
MKMKLVPTMRGLAVLAVIGLPISCFATMTQYGLYDTGVDASGNSLAGGSVDTHYTLDTVVPGTPVVVNNGFPIPPWVDYSPGNGDSRWISVNSGGGNDASVVDHIFTTTFTLTGLANATLSGKWASDNAGDLYLNGQLISTILFGAPGSYSFEHYTGFSTAVNDGLNTLVFIDHNGAFEQPDGVPGGPFGIRAENLTITGTPVPEASTVFAGAMMLLPFGLSAARIMRKNRMA